MAEMVTGIDCNATNTFAYEGQYLRQITLIIGNFAVRAVPLVIVTLPFKIFTKMREKHALNHGQFLFCNVGLTLLVAHKKV